MFDFEFFLAIIFKLGKNLSLSSKCLNLNCSYHYRNLFKKSAHQHLFCCIHVTYSEEEGAACEVRVYLHEAGTNCSLSGMWLKHWRGPPSTRGTGLIKGL